MLREFLVNLFFVLVEWIRGILLTIIPSLNPKKDVTDKIVLITGGASGIGRIMAQSFAKLGAIVVIWDVNETGLKEVEKDIKESGGKCYSYVCDISERKNVYSTADQVKANLGTDHIDILINNAGIVNGKRFLDLDDERIERLMKVNSQAHFWTTKAFLPSMMEKNSGHIVAIASIAGLSGGCNMSDYCASKFSNIGFMEALMYELDSDGYTGVKTTIVCPWYINTGLFAGVQTGIIPLLEPSYVAKRIVEAVLREQELLFLPRLLYFMYTLKTLLPIQAMIKMFRALNGHRQMDTFVGREGVIGVSKGTPTPSRAL